MNDTHYNTHIKKERRTKKKEKKECERWGSNPCVRTQLHLKQPP